MVYATYQCVPNEIRPFLEELEDADSAHAQMGAASKPTEAEDASTVFDESDSQEQHDPRRPATTPTEAPSSTFSKRADGVPQHYRRHSPARGMVIGDREAVVGIRQRAHSGGEEAEAEAEAVVGAVVSHGARPPRYGNLRGTKTAPPPQNGNLRGTRKRKIVAAPTDDDASVVGTIQSSE